MKGFLLGVGFDRMPEELHHGIHIKHAALA
jgi:hypothetical protein